MDSFVIDIEPLTVFLATVAVPLVISVLKNPAWSKWWAPRLLALLVAFAGAVADLAAAEGWSEITNVGMLIPHWATIVTMATVAYQGFYDHDNNRLEQALRGFSFLPERGH